MIKYDKIPQFSVIEVFMYVIKLGEDIISSTDDAIIAWVNYRNILRQATLSSDTLASIELDGQTLHASKVGGESLEFEPPHTITLNQVICDAMQAANVSPKQLAAKLNEQGVAISRSKVAGWMLSADSRKHQKIQLDELYLVLLVMLKINDFELGYTPNNLKKLVEITGLNQADFVRRYELTSSTFYNNITGIDSKNHRSMSYKSWHNLATKVFNDLKNM